MGEKMEEKMFRRKRKKGAMGKNYKIRRTLIKKKIGRWRNWERRKRRISQKNILLGEEEEKC